MSVVAPSLGEMQRRTGRKWSKHGADVLPGWIADMDFLPAPSIRAALREAIEIGDLGYSPTAAESGVPEAFAAWARRRWGWDVEPGQVQLMPDVISGLFNCLEALTHAGDGVLVQTPVYGPFISTVRALGRRLVEAPLQDGRIDFAALEAAVVDHDVRLMLLCNPHNPSGRVFTAEELQRLDRIAQRHGLIIVSDEVHADLVFTGHRHLPFASLSPESAARTVTLNSPSKAFNVAGLRTAVCITANPDLRKRLTALPASRWTPFSTMGVRAALAAWSAEGEEWLDDCTAQLVANRDLLARRLPEGVGFTPPEAGYLAWLDFRALGLADPAAYLLEHARVALTPGAEFGPPGAGHARMTFATSQEVLTRMIDQIATALAAR